MFTILCHPGSEMLFQLNPGYTSLSKCERIQLKLMKAISLQVSGCSAPFANTGNNTTDLMEGKEAPSFSANEPDLSQPGKPGIGKWPCLASPTKLRISLSINCRNLSFQKLQTHLVAIQLELSSASHKLKTLGHPTLTVKKPLTALPLIVNP